MQIQYILLIFISVITACTKNDKVVKEAEQKNINLHIESLDDRLFAMKSKQDAAIFLKDHPTFVVEFLGLPYPVQDSQFVDIFYKFYSDPALKGFQQQARKEFGDFSDLKPSFEQLFKYTNYFYPKYKTPELQTVVTGFKFEKDIALSDSVVIISYDYFLGPKASFKPPLFDYFLARYQKPYLVPMVAQAISGQFNNADLKDESMLANMIYYGKAHYFTERVLPELADSLNIMYTGAELKDAESHVKVIWGHFIEKKLIFDKTRFLVDKYCGERPNVLEIGDKCPGRIGRWLGWQIVRSYMKENPQVTLQDLMKDDDALKIFNKSKYKPAQ